MKRFLIIAAIIILGVVGLLAFSSSPNGDNMSQEETEASYQQISAEEVKSMMDNEEDFVLLDVRTIEEFMIENIAGAIQMPDYEVVERAAADLPDKNTIIITYCNRGVRSAKVARILSEMGYTRVYDMGGLINWPFETIAEKISE
jgi:rhodanese-related sulfurtransferase